MMPFVHELTIRHAAFDDTNRDDAGQPTRTVTETTVQGLVQPKSFVRDAELGDSRSAGSEVSDHVIFLPLDTAVDHADALDWGSSRLQVTGVRRYDFGRLPHLEVDARLVLTTTVTPYVAGS
jgi:hypothetical protein